MALFDTLKNKLSSTIGNFFKENKPQSSSTFQFKPVEFKNNIQNTFSNIGENIKQGISNVKSNATLPNIQKTGSKLANTFENILRLGGATPTLKDVVKQQVGLGGPIALADNLEKILNPYASKAFNTPQGREITSRINETTTDIPLKVISAVKAGFTDKTYREAYNTLKESTYDTNAPGWKKFLGNLQNAGGQTGVGVLLSFIPYAGRPLAGGYWTALSANEQIQNKGQFTSLGNVAIDVAGDEMLGSTLKGLFKKPANTLLKTMKESGIVEGGTEVLQTFFKNANDYKNARSKEERQKIIADTINYVKSGDILQEFAIGGIVGSGIGGAGYVANKQVQEYQNLPAREKQRGSINFSFGNGKEQPKLTEDAGYYRSKNGGSSFEKIDSKNVMPAPIKPELDTFLAKTDEGFSVIEGKTGQQIGDTKPTMSEALDSAKEIIAALPEGGIDTLLSEGNLSPRYQAPTTKEQTRPRRQAIEQLRQTTEQISSKSPLIEEAKKYKTADEFTRATLEKNSFITDKPITVYRGEGKGIGNETLVSGRYYADSKEFASNFGEVTTEEIPAGTKIFDLDTIKQGSPLFSDTSLVNPEKLTNTLLDNGFEYTKNTNSRGVEYVKLKRYASSDSALSDSNIFNKNYENYANLVDKFKTKQGFANQVIRDADKAWKDAGYPMDKTDKMNAPAFKILTEFYNQVKGGRKPSSYRTSETYDNTLEQIWNQVNNKKQSPKPKEEVKRTNKKLEQRAAQAKSFDEFYKRSGVTRESLDATAKNKGYKDAKDFYEKNKTVSKTKTIPEKKLVTLPAEEEARIPLFRELTELRKQIKNLGNKTEEDIVNSINQIENSIAILEENISEMPGRQLIKYRSRKEGEFLDFKDPGKAKTPSEAKRIEDYNERVLAISEDAFAGTPMADRYDDPDVIREAIDEYIKMATRRKNLQKSLKEKKAELRLLATRDLVGQISEEGKNSARKALEKLTDTEILQMNQDRFAQYLEGYLAEREAHRQARIALQATINDKELIKWENVRKFLKLPDSFDKMTPAQLNQLDEYLQKFETGDVFLGPKVMKTLNSTDLAGLHTYREVVDKTVENINKLRESEGKQPISLDQLKSIQPKERWYYMGGNALVRQNPLFEVMIHDIYKADIESGMAILGAEEEVNKLFDEARKSRKRGLLGRLIPTDERIFQWIEASPEDKLTLAKKMTPEEIKAAQYVQGEFQKMRDDLIKGQVLKKYMKNYVTHIRRSFLEAWKEEGSYSATDISGKRQGFWRRAGRGARAAFKELLDQYKQNEEIMNILDAKTSQVLPLEKWFQFSQKRSGQLKPSKNVARAFLKYKETFERKRALDSIIPKYQAIVDALSPMQQTPNGLDFNAKLKNFYKEFMNTQKGRVTDKGYVTPGGKIDWAIRSGTALTRILALGLNIPVGLTSQVGAQSVVYKGLGEKAYAKGLKRLSTSRGRKLAKKYEPIIGKSVSENFRQASSRFGDKAAAILYGLFSNADRNAKMAFLLGSMTKEEWNNKAIDLDRLAKIKRDMGKQMKIEGMGTSSIMGKTAGGSAYKQFKGWAIPLTSTTISQINKLVSKKVPINSPEGRELARSAILMATLIFITYSFMKEEDKNKDRGFLEEIAFKAARDSLSIIGALDPTVYVSSPALLTFLYNIGSGLKQIATFETTSKGNLKGVDTIKRTVTPTAIKKVLPKEKSTSVSSSSRGSRPTRPTRPERSSRPTRPTRPTR